MKRSASRRPGLRQRGMRAFSFSFCGWVHDMVCAEDRRREGWEDNFWVGGVGVARYLRA
jgi:hypothetical protein